MKTPKFILGLKGVLASMMRSKASEAEQPKAPKIPNYTPDHSDDGGYDSGRHHDFYPGRYREGRPFGHYRYRG